MGWFNFSDPLPSAFRFISSSLHGIVRGVPQGSILGLQLFFKNMHALEKWFNYYNYNKCDIKFLVFTIHGVCVHVLSSNGAQRFEELQFFASRDFIFQPWRFLLVTPSHQEMLMTQIYV